MKLYDNSTSCSMSSLAYVCMCFIYTRLFVCLFVCKYVRRVKLQISMTSKEVANFNMISIIKTCQEYLLFREPKTYSYN